MVVELRTTRGYEVLISSAWASQSALVLGLVQTEAVLATERAQRALELRLRLDAGLDAGYRSGLSASETPMRRQVEEVQHLAQLQGRRRLTRS